MEEMFNNKVNLLKALAIILVVSGHLGISFIPLFPTYSFHMALFFFISGYVFKEKHLENIGHYIKNKAKRLLLPYLIYIIIYLKITAIVAKFTGIFYGNYFSITNFTPRLVLEGLYSFFIVPLWFIPQLFISLIAFVILYKYLRKYKDNKYFHLITFLFLAVWGIQTFQYSNTSIVIFILRTLFSMFFIYLGFFYKNFMERQFNIFSVKCFGAIIILQSLLWLFNKSDTPYKGMVVGLDYMLVSGTFQNSILPILTSITGIWASLFIINAFYPYIKDNKFLEQVGKNTYHIMANHFLVIYVISNFFLWINKLPDSTRVYDSVIWVYNPSRTSFLYLILAITIPTAIGVSINMINNILKIFMKSEPSKCYEK